MRCVKILLCIVLTVVLAGCFASKPEDIQAFSKPNAVAVTALNYVLQPPDEIEIHCTKIPEIHMQKQIIRPDGKISFESLGQIDVAGKTIGEATEAIKQKAMGLYNLTSAEPIDIQLLAYQSKVYYVLGQVAFPGPKQYTGRDSVIYAISFARPNALAWLDQVQVIKPSKDADGKAKIFKADYKKMREIGDMQTNVLVEEGDIIYVPPTVIGAVALVLEEFLTPIGRAFSTVNIIQGPPGNRQ